MGPDCRGWQQVFAPLLPASQAEDLGHLFAGHTGGQAPRGMSVQMAFFGAARLSLDAATLQAVTERMRALGAQVDDLPPLP